MHHSLILSPSWSSFFKIGCNTFSPTSVVNPSIPSDSLFLLPRRRPVTALPSITTIVCSEFSLSTSAVDLSECYCVSGLQDADLCTEILSAHGWDKAYYLRINKLHSTFPETIFLPLRAYLRIRANPKPRFNNVVQARWKSEAIKATKG